MDTKRHNSPEYYKTLQDLYTKKYKNIKFDIILATDNNAFNFLVQNRNKIFGEVPVAFSGVNGFEEKMLEGVSKFTGVAERFSVKETVNTILKLHPELKNIYIINDYLTTGLAWKKDIKKELQGYEKKVNLLYSDNLLLKNLKNRVNSFGSDTAVLMGVYFADRDKNYITYEKIGTYLLGESQAPVYCLLNFNISNNVIGGKVIGGYSQGEAMSKTAVRILEGNNPDNIPVISSGANKFVFNYNGIKKYNIDESLLPKKSKIINKPYSLYEEYKFILFNLIFLFAALLLIFLLFLFFSRPRREEGSFVDYKESIIILILRFAPIIIMPIATIVVIWLFIYSSNENHKELQQRERELYVENMKQESKREVDRFIQIVRSSLKANDNTMSMEHIQKNLLSIASDARYGKSGYLIIGTRDGHILSHPRQALKNSNVFDGKHEKAKKIVLKFLNITKEKGSGFVSYNWNNPDTQKVEKKITYVSELPELGWYVASGVYLDEIEKSISKKLKEQTSQEQKNIIIIIIASIILILFALSISLTISTILKNVFNSYRENIIQAAEKNKEKERLLFQQSKMAEIGEMMRAILHQWKQPINVISLTADTIDMINEEDLPQKNEILEDTSRNLRQQVRFMVETIEHFRDFSTPNSKEKLFLACETIEDITTMFNSQFEKKNIQIIIKEHEHFNILGKKAEFMQVVLNLLSNARDAFENKEMDNKQIICDFQKEKKSAKVVIADNAGGIPADLLPDKLFESDFTTKESGTGIGLHICKLIIEKNFQGKIWAENRGNGAQFTIELPIR